MRLYLIDQLLSKRQLTFELFLRLMGLVYFCAFFSLVFQIDGLFGEHGILPVSDYLEAVKSSNGALSYLTCPTLLWLSSSSQALLAITIAGSAVSLLLIAGCFPVICTTVLYFLYLSITSVGQEFLSYQWDMLLLQAGFLTIIVSLLRSSPDCGRLRGLATFLIFLLDFRLMFASGMCKLASGDPTWSGLTALTYHFSTQPLPTPLAIFANALPLELSKCLCWCTLAIEIIVPFLIFAPRRIRLFALALLAFLQIAIALTGNYCFFNLLTFVLLIPLADDCLLTRLIGLWPLKFKTRAEKEDDKSGLGLKAAPVARAASVILIALVSFNCLSDLGGRSIYRLWPGPLLFVRALSQTFGIDNSYGLFAVMTRERPEIIVEGSDDGINYKAYQFSYKVSRPDQAPPIVAPHQPRLDWQMWFEGLNATYGDPYSPERGLNQSVSPWFIKFLARLSEEDRPVLNLLAKNPFPDHPPKYLRARVVNYYLVSPTELMHTGLWWKTKEIGIYYDSKLLSY
jgi:lipase maturation factor 1